MTVLLPLLSILITADDNGDELPLIVTLYAGCWNDCAMRTSNRSSSAQGKDEAAKEQLVVARGAFRDCHRRHRGCCAAMYSVRRGPQPPLVRPIG